VPTSTVSPYTACARRSKTPSMNGNDTTNTNHKPESLGRPPSLDGLEWGEQRHSFALQERGGQVQTAPRAFGREPPPLVQRVEQRFGGRPVRLSIETAATRSSLRCCNTWLEIYPSTPSPAPVIAAPSLPPAQGHLPDALVCLELVRDHARQIAPAGSPRTRRPSKLAVWSRPDATW